MKKLHKYGVVVICLGCIIGITISLKENDSDNIRETNVNPIFNEEDYWAAEMFSNITFDIGSENISASIEKEKLYLSDKILDILLTNDKKGTGFYFYGVPAIEKMNENKWERLSYKESDPSREQWCVCAIEEAEDICFSTNISVDVDNINNFTEGSYRAVIFLTDRNIYVPFEVVGDK